MAAVTHRHADTPDTSNASSYTSGSFTPGNGELLVVVVDASGTAATGTVTDSIGGTYTRIIGAQHSSADLIAFFVRDALIGTGVSMTVTFDCTGDNATGCNIFVAGVSGMTRTGASAVRQSDNTDNTGAGTTPSITFPAAALTGNPTIVAIGNASNPAGCTPPTSLTELADVGYSTPTRGTEYASRDSGFTGTTITWGAASASAWGAVGIELDTSAAATEITPGVGATTLAGFAPTIGLPVTVTSGVGGLTITGFAPTLERPVTITSGVGGVTIQGYAPTIEVTAGTTVSPGVGNLQVTGFAPTVGLPVTIRPNLGTLQITGFAPTLSLPVTIRPGVGGLVVTGHAPTLTVPRNILSGTGALQIAGFAPTLSLPVTIRPGVGSVTIQGHAPTIDIGGATPPERRATGWRRVLYDPEGAEKAADEGRDELGPHETLEAVPLPDVPAAPEPRDRTVDPIRLPKRKPAPVDSDDDEEEEIHFILNIVLDLD
jgi:hypothetical protein